MILLSILRFLFFIKWCFQLIGFITLVNAFSDSWNGKLLAIISLFLLIIPELAMACALWIGKGIISTKMQNTSSSKHYQIEVFGPNLCKIFKWIYLILLLSIGALLGSFWKVSILSTGIVFLLCWFLRKNLKRIFNSYLLVT